MRILVVNPNTTASMTQTIAVAARKAAAAGTEIVALSPTMGPESIEGYYDEAFAVPGLLEEIVKGERSGADAAVIACFDDTGLDAARTAAAIPVVGICEAAMHMATLVGGRFSVVTTLSRSVPALEHLALRYGMERRCTVRASDIPVLELERDPGAFARIADEIERALTEDRAESIVLGCAGMTDLADRLSQQFGVPVIDGVTAAVKLAEALVGLGLRTSKVGGYASPRAKAYAGLLSRFAPGSEDGK